MKGIQSCLWGPGGATALGEREVWREPWNAAVELELPRECGVFKKLTEVCIMHGFQSILLCQNKLNLIISSFRAVCEVAAYVSGICIPSRCLEPPCTGL